MKDKLLNSLGIVGLILYFVITNIFVFAPLYVLDIPGWLFTGIIIAANIFPKIYGFTSPVLWIIAFIEVINGPQDIIAIIFYVILALWVVYYLITFLIPLFKKKKS